MLDVPCEAVKEPVGSEQIHRPVDNFRGHEYNVDHFLCTVVCYAHCLQLRTSYIRFSIPSVSLYPQLANLRASLFGEPSLFRFRTCLPYWPHCRPGSTASFATFLNALSLNASGKTFIHWAVATCGIYELGGILFVMGSVCFMPNQGAALGSENAWRNETIPVD